MKALLVSVLSIAMLASAMFAFAFSVGATTQQNLQVYREWVGKSAAQMVTALGKPSYTSTDKSGRRTYDYVLEQQRAGPVLTYQFVIGADKKVDTARQSF